ncbi:hypothetical protein RSOLAG22IIIB_09582 [Rhizoctonia solani]|uniref:DUF7587 domain-containing protein n=1 Tax=Rhizoctonia solani TaxID=456999 RepID=A0A0K6FYX7_9AGAM|nr:hypothetical protein RSOLAG22IIIB_09582 [Rhizoctonia solani]
MFDYDFRNGTSSKQYLPSLSGANFLSERVTSTRIVFRVFDSSSFRGYDSNTGFVATGFSRSSSLNDQRLADAHLNWNNHTIVTPWLSTSRRWHWAIWEMNRRFGGSFSSSQSQKPSSTGICVAVIDLEACRGTARPPVHALSVLGPTSEYRKFANISDEILIYGKIPKAAILSIWGFEKAADIIGLPRSISLHMPSGSYLSYRDVHSRFVESLYNPSQAQEWKVQEGGELCASIAIAMIQAGYRRLERQLDTTIGPIRAATASKSNHNSPDDLMDSLVREMGALSTVGAGSRATNPRTSGIGSDRAKTSEIEEAVNLISKGTNLLHSTVARSPQEVTGTVQHMDNTGQSEYDILDAYSTLLTHHKTVRNQLSASALGDASSLDQAYDQLLHIELLFFRAQKQAYETVLIRMARQRIEFFRSAVLEFARTVPLGLLDQLDVKSQDWVRMKWGMMGRVDAWLAPLERKLEGLEDKDVPELIRRAKLSWLKSERSYPIYWETLGVRQTAHGTAQTGSER